MESTRKLRVFLCHSSDDKAAVRDLYERLTHLIGIEPWLDEKVLLGGQDWDLEISRAVRSSDVILVCLSRGAVTKEGYVQKEIRQALDMSDEKPEGTIFLIPVRLEDCDVPQRLRQWQWVDLNGGVGFHNLESALQTRARSLGISIEISRGTLVYDSCAERTPFSSWTLYSTAGATRERIRVTSSGLSRPAFELRAFGDELVGVCKSIRILNGAVEFDYRADVCGPVRSNLVFYMIPMQETGINRFGLIEVGTNVQDAPQNTFSPHRARYGVPQEHLLDGLWHRARLDFDFRNTATAFYSVFGPRINEGCMESGPGHLLVTDVQVFGFE